MKRILLTCIILIIMIEILLFPKESMLYASTGLRLWFDNMIPALFPFMVLSGLIIRLELAPSIVSFLHPLLYKIFHTNQYCEYVITMGFLCGYPMGAVIINDLIKEEKISLAQGEYLLAFRNNVGPVFYCSLVLPMFEKKYYTLLLCGMYLIPLFYGIIMRYTFYKKAFITEKNTIILQKINQNTDIQFGSALINSLNRAVSASLYLGGCMIFFNMLRLIPMHFSGDNKILSLMACWLLEVNGAISMSSQLCANGYVTAVLLMLPFLAIGGLSCICQTIGVLSDTKCNIKVHIFHKSIQAFTWFCLTLLWLLMKI